MLETIRKIACCEDGASAVLLAAALPPLVGIAALAVDLGALYLSERRLQNIADAAATASITGTDEAARLALVNQAITDSGQSGVVIAEFVDGEYLRDREIHYSARFDTTSLYPNATRVVLRQDVPLFFGSLLTGTTRTQVSAQALATRMDMAGFMLGSHLIDLSGGLSNSVLSALAGSELGLSDHDLSDLQSGTVDILDFAEALATLQGDAGATFGEVFDGDTPLHVAVEALADAVGDSGTAAILDGIALELNGDYLTLSDLVELGPLRNTDVNDGHSGVDVDVYSLLRSLLQAAHGESYEISLDTDIAGLAGVAVRLAGGHGEERSPWLTIDSAQGVTLRTAETRLYVEARTGSIAGLPSALDIPIYAELSSAEAEMTDIVCAAGDGSEGVYIDATPSIGTLAMADVDTMAFDDFSTPLWLERATIIDAGPLEVSAYAEVALGGDRTTNLHFTMENIADRTPQSVGTADAVEGIASSLVDDVDLDVEVAGLGLGLGGIADIVGSTLLRVAPSLDALIVDLTDILGVRLGAAEVTVDRIRCGQPTLVG